MPELLVNSSQVARMLGVSSGCLTNWRTRGTGPMPAPDYEYITPRGKAVPLWTVAQVEKVIAARTDGALSALKAMQEKSNGS